MKNKKIRFLSIILAIFIIITVLSSTSFANLVDDKMEAGDAIDEILENEIEELKLIFDKKDNYDYMTSIGLRYAGYDKLKIQSRMNIYGMNTNHNNSRNIINIIGSGLNPRDCNNKNYINMLKNSIDEVSDPDYLIEHLSKTIIALEMVEEEYDFDEVFRKIKEELIIKEDMAYAESFGRTNSEATAWLTIALSFHKDNREVSEIIEKTKNFYKNEQDKFGLIGTSQDTALVVQALTSLGEDPLSEEWILTDESNNKTTMLDGIMRCKVDGKGFALNPGGNTVGYFANQHILAAFADMYKGKSMFKNIKYAELGEPKKIEINLKNDEILVGETIELKANILDENDNIIDHLELIWDIEDKSVAKIDGNKLTGLKSGAAFVKVHLKDNQDIFDKREIEVRDLKDISFNVEAALEKIIGFYKNHKSIDYTSSLATRHIEDYFYVENLNVKDNLRLYSMDHAIHYAKNIMEIVGAKENPTNYEVKNKDNETENKNFIKLLEDSQDENGYFIVAENQDAGIVSQSLSIMALDMVNGNYNREKAIDVLADMLRDSQHEKDGLYDKLETKALGATALSKYKSNNEIKTLVDEQIAYLKEQQNEKGGYDYRGYENGSFSIGTVIQCLIANDIDPKTWTKNGNNMVSVLLNNQLEDGMFKFSSGFEIDGEGVSEFKATEIAFAALADVYNKKSMYNVIKYEDELEPEKPIEDFEIQYIKKGSIVNDVQTNVRIKIRNLTDANRKVNIKVELYDKNTEERKSYSLMHGNFKPNEEKELEINFLIPKKGDYYITYSISDNI